LRVEEVPHPTNCVRLNNNKKRITAADCNQGKKLFREGRQHNAGLRASMDLHLPEPWLFRLSASAKGFSMNGVQHVRHRLGAGFALLLLGSLAHIAHAETVLNLEPAQDHLNFSVPLDAPLAAGDQLAVELDGYDVTALLSCTGGDCQLALPVPLAGGSHPLRAMIFYDNGDIATVLEARVQVAGSAIDGAGAAEDEQPGAPDTTATDSPGAPVSGAAKMAVQQRFSALFSSGYRLDEQQPDNYHGISRQASNGGLSYQGAGESADWRWDAQLDAMYDSLSENNPGSDEWVLPNYRLAASRGSGLSRQGLALGTYNVARDDLLFSAYQRRGVVMSLGDDFDSPLKLDVFGLQSEPITGYQDRLAYPQSPQERTSGGLLTLTPWQDEPQLLQLSSAFINGETTEAGTGMWAVDEQTRYGGDTWNMAVDSRLGDNSLWLHADYARTSFDSDGIGYGQGDRSGTAHELLAQFSSGSWLPAGHLISGV